MPGTVVQVPTDGCLPAVRRVYGLDLSLDSAAAKGILTMYRKEISNFIIKDDLSRFDHVIGGKKEREIIESKFDMSESEGRKALLKLLIPKDNSVLHTDTWRTIVQLLQTLKRDGLVDLLKVVNSYDSGDHVLKYLANVQLLQQLLDKDALYDVLKPIIPMLPELLRQEIAMVDSKKPDLTRSLHKILRQLPYCGPEWYWRLLSELIKDPIGAVIVEEIDEDFEEHKKKYFANKDAMAGRSGHMGAESKAVDAEYDQEKEEDIIEDDEFGKPVEELTLRPYQKELVGPALQAKNTVVCAVTGSGKTLVAVKAIQDHLSRREKPKVVFLVPTVVLVEQQRDVLRKYLRNKYHIIGIQGGHTFIPKSSRIKKADIIVLTPQILLNTLRDATSPKGLTLHDFSLIVFDECHHTDKLHPYKEIMDRYMDIKMSLDDQGPIPQILGLTASLGVAKGAQTWETVVPYIERICSHLDVTALSSVVSKEGKQNLDEFVKTPRDRLVQVRGVRSERSEVPFVMHIENRMRAIEMQIDQILDDLLRNGTRLELSPRPDMSLFRIRLSAQYQSWVHAMYREIATSQINDTNARKMLRTYLQYLKICVNGLYLHTHITLERTVHYLNEELNEIKKQITVDAELNLFRDMQMTIKKIVDNIELASNEGKKNPLLEKLVEILLEMKNRNQESKAIIFVKTRELAHELTLYLAEFHSIKSLKAAKFTSSNVSSDRFGISPLDRAETEANFRSGQIRLLVSTSVLEEGVDVPTCNLIVKYNHVSSLISAIQRRGRGRADSSESILLCAEGWVAEQELSNLMQEQMMNHAIANIIARGSNALEKSNESNQRQEFINRCNARELKKKQDKLLVGRKYDFVCPRCCVVLASSGCVRIIHKCHYVIVDDKFWNRVIIDPSANPKSYYMVTFVANIVCNGDSGAGCGEVVGKVLTFKNGFFPSLKAKSIVLRDSSGKERPTFNWQRMSSEYFVIKDITEDDVKRMCDKLTERCITDVTSKSGDYVVKCLQKQMQKCDEEVKEKDMKVINDKAQWNQHLNKFLEGEEEAAREKVDLYNDLGGNERNYDD